MTFGIGLGTLRYWENGDGKPHGPALVLLRVIDKDDRVLRALAWTHDARRKAAFESVTTTIEGNELTCKSILQAAGRLGEERALSVVGRAMRLEDERDMAAFLCALVACQP